MMDQKSDFLRWISLSTVTPQKGDGGLSEPDHRNLVRKPTCLVVHLDCVVLAHKVDFLSLITAFLKGDTVRFHGGWCVGAYLAITWAEATCKRRQMGKFC